MASIFTRIINGEIPCYKVAETEHCLAFLDISPLALGHTLVIPKQEVDLLFDVPNHVYQEMWSLSRDIAKVLKEEVDCLRIGVAVVGLEVPHAHIHLVPLNEIGDLNFKKERVKLTEDQFDSLSNTLQSRLA